jgi:hypothetical protein
MELYSVLFFVPGASCSAIGRVVAIHSGSKVQSSRQVPARRNDRKSHWDYLFCVIFVSATVVSSGGSFAGGLGKKQKGFLLSTGKLLTLPLLCPSANRCAFELNCQGLPVEKLAARASGVGGRSLRYGSFSFPIS